MPGTIGGVILIIIFIIPGFLVNIVKKNLVTHVSRTTFEQTIESIIFSCINYIITIPIWITPFKKIIQSATPKVASQEIFNLFTLAPYPTLFWSLCLIFFIPILVGIVYVVLLRHNVLHWILRAIIYVIGGFGRTNVKTSSSPELWDLLLDRQTKPWIRAYLDDGRVIIGKGIRFSAHPTEKQIWMTNYTIYDSDLNIIYDQDADSSADKPEGIYLLASKIASLEVF